MPLDRLLKWCTPDSRAVYDSVLIPAAVIALVLLPHVAVRLIAGAFFAFYEVRLSVTRRHRTPPDAALPESGTGLVG